MKKWCLIPVVAGLSVAQAQDGPLALPIEDLVAKQDQAVLDKQGTEIFHAMDHVGKPYHPSVVSIIAGNRKIVGGIVVAPGKVMTKYSDLASRKAPLAVLDAGEKVHDMRVLAVSEEHDIVLLDVPGLEAPPIDFNNSSEADEGSMIFVLAPEGKVTEFGVISVGQRSLRAEDRAYIGIEIDPRWSRKGAWVSGVDPNSPAFQAGLQRGDIVEKINGKEIEGVLSLYTTLKNVNPGDTMEISVRRGDAKAKGTLTAARRPPPQRQFREFPESRLEQMNAMGNKMSRRRDRFPLVYQSDVTLKPERAGSPVIDLNGKFVGMALSRAGRIETYILPAWAILELTDEIMAQTAGRTAIPAAEPVDE